jgi:hypothetical protein
MLERRMAMIVVKSVDVEQVAGDRFYSMRHPDFFDGDFSKPMTAGVEKKVVEGQPFRNVEGQDVMIGWSKEVEEAIGLPLLCLRDQRERIDALQEDNMRLRRRRMELVLLMSRLNDRLDSLSRMSFWQRLKFLLWKEA